MSNGEIAYLALAIGAFVTYACLLAYGMAVASERPTQQSSSKQGNSAADVRKAA